jgi:hypothetical protein
VRTPAGLERDHRVLHDEVGPHPPEEPLDEALGVLELEHRAEAALEVRVVEAAALEVGQQLPGHRVPHERVADGLRAQPLVDAERLEALEDVRGQHAAPVDEQALAWLSHA